MANLIRLIIDVLRGNTIIISKTSESNIDVHCGRQFGRDGAINSLASALQTLVSV